MFRNFIGGLFFGSLMFFTAFFGSIFMMGPTMPLLLLNPTWFRYTTDKLMSSWLVLPIVSIHNEVIFGMNVKISDEGFPSNLVRNEKVVFIMNHRTRLDWMYFWSVIYRRGKLENEKIILKNELKHIPGAGWAMQLAMFIFIKRNWERDERYLHEILQYFTDNNYPLQLLIFPEGTDLDVESAAKSKSYALKNNLPIYKHVLHPRLKGFIYCVEQLRSHGNIDAIYDVTIGYQGKICQSESDLALGNFPCDVHFHIKRYTIDSIPKGTEELEKWCTQKWVEKEATLDKFYKEGNFVPEIEEKSRGEEWGVHYQMMFWIVYWITFLCVVILLLYYYSCVRWYAVIVGSMLCIVSSKSSGFETLQVKRHTLMMESDNSRSCSQFEHQNGKTHAS